MVINLIKKSFMDVVKNPVVTLFLVLYFITISIIISVMNMQSNVLIYLALALCAILFIATFIAGWFRIVRELTQKKEKLEEAEIAKENVKTLPALFLEGAGENVVPYLIGFVIYIVFSFLFTYVAYLISAHFFGSPEALIQELQNQANIMDMTNLPQDKMTALYGFQFCLMMAMSACLFLFMYYFPAIAYDTSSKMFVKPFIAIKNAFCFLFKKFFESVGIYLMLCFINVCAVLLRAYLPKHPITDVLYIFYVVYFLSFAVMLICNYYEANNSCDNGSDCIRENDDSDKTGEEE